MTDELKLDILHACALKANSIGEVQELIDLLTAKPIIKTVERKNRFHDGVYVIFKDDTYKEWNFVRLEIDKMDVKEVKGIGIVFHGFAFGVALYDLGFTSSLLLPDGTSEKDSPLYKSEIEALNDFNMINCNQHLKSAGLGVSLPTDCYVPTLGQLGAEYLFRKDLYEALATVGGEVLREEVYLSSSENSKIGAFGLSFASGYVGCYNKKTARSHFRPVFDFDPHFSD